MSRTVLIIVGDGWRGAELLRPLSKVGCRILEISESQVTIESRSGWDCTPTELLGLRDAIRAAARQQRWAEEYVP